VIIKLKSPQAILLDAADTLDSRGWVQGELEDRDGAVCVIGALNVATYGHSERPECADRRNDHQVDRAMLCLRSAIEWDGGQSLPEWNDRQDRKKLDVLAALRKAAKSAPRTPVRGS